MTFGGRLVSLFPLVHVGVSAVSFFCFLYFHDWGFLGLTFFSVYLLPLLVFRVHNLFWPLTEGTFDLAARKYSAWWASYQFQYLFVALPFLETPLHFVPGAFSLWLRLWGSDIGKNVVWTPRVEVVDRGLIHVGANVVVGHITGFCSHVIVPRGERLILMVKKIEIGDGCFIGADSHLGPGAKIPAGELVKAKSTIYWEGLSS